MTAIEPISPPTSGTDAQKLITISLGKMAASRVGKSGSLHKSLLVASVLHRARHVFLEENYRNYQYSGQSSPPVPIYAPHIPPPPPPPTLVTPVLKDYNQNDENVLSNETTTTTREELPGQVAYDKEESCPRTPLGDASNQQRVVALKRRRCVSDKETQDAVSSILPKRFRPDESLNENLVDENVVVSGEYPESSEENTDSTSDVSPPQNSIYCGLEPISDDEEEDDDDANSMEVEHITSLVSIFSFGAPRKDLCSTQVVRDEPAQFTPVALAV